MLVTVVVAFVWVTPGLGFTTKLKFDKRRYSFLDADPLRLATNYLQEHDQHQEKDEPDDITLPGHEWSVKAEGKYKIRAHLAGTKPKCDVTYMATSGSDKETRCPAACPYYTQNRADDRYCTFICVTGIDCKKYNPLRPIADDRLGNCRAPMVQACREYVLSARESKADECAVCNSGYALGSDGQCHYKFMVVILTITVIALLVIFALVFWIVDIARRPVTNAKGLREAMAFKERNMLHSHREAEHHETHGGWASQQGGEFLFPLSTNLCKIDVAGSGMLLHFNFQVSVMVWGLWIASIWLALCVFVDPALFVLGTRKFGTPRSNCILVAWGSETQTRLMWCKVMFLWIAYISSTLMALLHSIRQSRLHDNLDYEHKTMKDFAAIVTGLPMRPGAELVEEDLKKAAQEFFGGDKDSIVGASVGFVYQDIEDDVLRALRLELKRQEAAETPVVEAEEGEIAEYTGYRKKFYDLELKYFGPEKAEETEEELEAKTKEMLLAMTSSDNAILVFSTEEGRDKALEKSAAAGGFAFHGEKCKLEEPHCEPGTVMWNNFGPQGDDKHKAFRLLQGVGWVMLALLFWTLVFYLPYAWSIFQFNYDNGQEPGFAYSMTFTIVVAVGNAIMYEVCNRVAEHVGFKFKDDKESAYLIFYTVACTFNILVDFCTTYIMAFTIMSELGFRTYDGTPLRDVPLFPQGFETYAMQRTLAENTKAYAFPSTFLIPFLIEPFPTVFLPLWFGKLLVSRHKEIQGVDAEEWVVCAPMEMGRYGDILLDIVLCIMIFFFPGGYTIFLFLAMVCCHVYVYAWDHWRVLRTIPSCVFASSNIDWWAQAMLAPCCGLIGSCLMFKSQNQRGMDWANSQFLGVWGNIFACGTVFVIHCIVHMLLLVHIVPLFKLARPEDSMSDVTYADVAETVASSWFTTNPVWCLRSQRIYEHSPPCEFLVNGKEHLLRINEEIGCFYAHKKNKTEWDAEGAVAEPQDKTAEPPAEPVKPEKPASKETTTSNVV